MSIGFQKAFFSAISPDEATTNNQTQLDSLNLARTQLARQLEGATHENRRTQIGDAISAVELRILRGIYGDYADTWNVSSSRLALW